MIELRTSTLKGKMCNNVPRITVVVEFNNKTL